jgi:hypothetical protein
MFARWFLAATAVLLVVAVDDSSAQDKKAWDPAAGTAEIKGSIKFNGKAPRRRKVDMGADEQCTKMHEKAPLDETVIVNDNGTLRNVFVWVKKGLDGWTFPVPSEAKVLEQKGCTYVPHVFGIMVGQALTVRNGDDTMHNIHGLGQKNAEFNFSQPKKGQEDVRKFANTEVMLKVKCDVHGWMSSYAGVVPHPFYAVSGEDGSFKLPALPPGEYEIEVWHEKYGTQTATVKLGDKESKQLDFTFEGAKQ